MQELESPSDYQARALPKELNIKPSARVTLGSKKSYKQLSYGATRSMLRDCAERAGIKKRVWLYLIRHSRITPASKILPHSLLCATAGWKQGSRMPSVYIHLAGEDVDEAQCILSGTAKLEKKDEQLKPLVCSRCQNNNVPGSKFCTRCGTPLDLKTAIRLDQTRTKLDRLFNKLTEDPQKLDKLLTLIERA
jgi:integrase/recombinase XerD